MKHARGRHRFTIADYYRMGEVGILGEDGRVELLEGEIYDMNPIGSVHAATLTAITNLLYARAAGLTEIRVQNPVHLDDQNAPQPDIALVRASPDHYLNAHPRPEDVLLLIEVADSSARSDRLQKLPLYAAADIREVWLVDLPRSQVEVHRDPKGGQYATVRNLLPGLEIEPQLLPGVRLAVADLLPPAGARP
jgi:Uma2 family endonuclease